MIAVALAEALVERFRPLLSPDMLVANDADMVILRRDATRGWIGVGLDVSEMGSDVELERATYGALRALQEFMCEQLAHPWPTPNQHQPGVRVDEREIHLYLGDFDAPALRLPSIPREALRS
jgi:hypothetical protein